MDKKKLAVIIKRNRLVSNFFGASSLGGILSTIGTNLDNAKISMKTYAVGALYATQSSITPTILKQIKKGIWNAESNEFFKKGQEVDFTKEPIIVMGYGNNNKYIAVGHTRAKYIYDKDGLDTQISAIDVNHLYVKEYVNNIKRTIGSLKKLPQLR